MTIFQRNEREVDVRRDAARSALSMVWHRGDWLSRIDACDAMIKLSGGALPPWDRAAAQGMLADLVGAGLLVHEWRGDQPGYLRPDEDIAVATIQPGSPSPVMWVPFDGSEPRPYADVLAEQATRNNQNTLTEDQEEVPA